MKQVIGGSATRFKFFLFGLWWHLVIDLFKHGSQSSSMEFRSFVYFYLDKNILPSICCSIKILWDIHNMLFSNPNQMFGILTYSRIIEKNYLTPLSLRNYRCEYFQEQFTPQWGGGGLILKIWEKNKKWTSRARGKFFIFFFFYQNFPLIFIPI